MKDFLFIVLLVLLNCFLGGCRAKSETSSSRSSTIAAEIGVELRRVDSLWSSLAESRRLKIEFYPPMEMRNEECGVRNVECGMRNADCGMKNKALPHGTEGLQTIIQKSLGNGTSIAFTGSRSPAAPLGQAVADVGTFHFTGDCGGGLGAVKSIEILTEKTEDMGGIRTTDSVSGQKSYTKETLQEERASEARQDNGSVVGLAVVGAVAVVLYMAIRALLKHLLKMTRCIQIGKEIVAIWGDERDGKMTLGKMVVVPASLFKNQLKLKTDNCKL